MSNPKNSSQPPNVVGINRQLLEKLGIPTTPKLAQQSIQDKYQEIIEAEARTLAAITRKERMAEEKKKLEDELARLEAELEQVKSKNISASADLDQRPIKL